MLELSTKSLNPPRVINNLMRGQWAAAIISNAVGLKMFDAVDLGFRSASEVARECELDKRAAEILLNALVSLELLTKDENGFNTTEESHYYLVSTSPLYIGPYFEIGPRFQESWQNLSNVAKTGKPFSEVNKQETAQQFFPALAAALFSLNFAYGRRLAEFLAVEESKEKLKVLDLACGSAVWSIPMARCNKNVSVDALDFPVVLDVTREFVEKSGVKDRYTFLSGNWQDIALKENEYDIVILGHILHSEGKERSKELLSCVHSSLKKGGRIAVAEFLVDDSRTSPTFSAMFAVNMMLVTTDGCVFSRNELTAMLKEAGFSNDRDVPASPEDANVVVADKI